MANNKDKNKEKEVGTKPRKITKSELKAALKNAEIDIVSNDNAQLLYICPITHQEIYLDEYGDTESVSMDVLQSMKSKAKDFFRKYWVIIEDVYIPDSELDITVEDVYNYLGLSNVYKEISEFEGGYFDSLLLKEKTEKFEKRVEDMDKKMLGQLISRSVTLYKDGSFNNSSKQRLLEDITDNEFLYKEGDLKPKKKNK